MSSRQEGVQINNPDVGELRQNLAKSLLTYFPDLGKKTFFPTLYLDPTDPNNYGFSEALIIIDQETRNGGIFLGGISNCKAKIDLVLTDDETQVVVGNITTAQRVIVGNSLLTGKKLFSTELQEPKKEKEIRRYLTITDSIMQNQIFLRQSLQGPTS